VLTIHDYYKEYITYISIGDIEYVEQVERDVGPNEGDLHRFDGRLASRDGRRMQATHLHVQGEKDIIQVES
jgi:hypothetical protein